SATTRLASVSVEAFMEGRTDGASLKERELAIALRNLQAAGWMFVLVRGEAEEMTPLEAAGAYRALLDEKRASASRGLERVRAVDPKANAFDVEAADQMASLDYFHGTGAPASLKNAALAKKLQSLAASGIESAGGDVLTPGTWGAYVALTRGERAFLRIEGVDLGEVCGTHPDDIDAAAAPCLPLLDLLTRTLVPASRKGQLDRGSLGGVLNALHYEVPEVTLEERSDAFLRLAEAVAAHGDGGGSAAERTARVIAVYEAVLELDVGGDAFFDAVATMETLVGVVGPEKAREPLQLLYREAGRSSPFPEARREREEVFRRVVAWGVEPARAVEITQQIVARAHDEELEIRVQLFEALSELLEHQPAYAGIMNDYQTVLRYRSSEESLEDAARPYLAIFEALAGRGLADQTATTWAFLHEGLRHGHLESGDGALQTLADRFVSLFTQVRNVREACQRLLH
ncbi:MAG: hypothetical protein EB084_14300, partial [Proteobacteria bacterium]|nr:hypothetical protein [Pseudomonadota bacterium]